MQCLPNKQRIKGNKGKKEHALTKQNGAKWCGGWWFVGEDGVPDHGQEEATVQVHVWGGFPDLDGFHTSPQPELFGPSSDCCAFPVNVMVGLLDMNCNTILGVSSFYRLSMFTQSDFQCPLCFSHIHLWAILTWYLANHSCLFQLWGPVLLLH